VDLSGKVALVTGAGRGIGRVIALTLAEHGARVMGAARTENDLRQVAAEAPVEWVAESVATLEGCRRIVNETIGRLGPVDILVNNAGTGAGGKVWELSPEQWHEVLAVNLDAAFYLCKLTAPGMVSRRSGRIVMISSTAGEVGAAGYAAFCASKHGLLGLMRSVAHEVGPAEVTCNAVCPGWVRTPEGDREAAAAGRLGITVEELWAERTRDYPARRPVTAHEIADTVAFLASDEASAINGEAITVALGGVW
jgi:NAD(P)-dependent dehydrogenase (short-subunit alcohol dehydrogenase family)